MNERITSYDALPLTLNANDVANTLGISKSNAYALMHAKSFPTIHLGRRMIVPKESFIKWLESQLPTSEIAHFT